MGSIEYLKELEARYTFALWDILKELDRRERRKQRDRGHIRKVSRVRAYMNAHPEVVRKLVRGTIE